MIAQGEFQKLLLAGTEERKTIFRDIFNTRKYETLQKRLSERSSNLTQEYLQTKRSIDTYIQGTQPPDNEELKVKLCEAHDGKLSSAETIELINEIILYDKSILEKLTKQIAENDEALNRNAVMLGKAEEIHRTKVSLENDKIKLSDLLPKRKEFAAAFENEQKLIPAQDKLKSEITKAESSLKEYDDLDDSIKRISQTEYDLSTKSDLLESLKKSTESLKEELENNKSELSDLKDIYLIREKLSQKEMMLKQQSDDADTLGLDVKSLNKLTEELKKAQKKYKQYSDTANEKQLEYDSSYKAYLDNQAGILAHELAENKPCPVCGSLSHPSPARTVCDAPSKNELDALKQSAEQARKDAAKASENAAAIIAKYDSLKDTVAIKASELFGEISSENPDEKLSSFIKQISEEKNKIEIEIKAADIKIKRYKELEVLIPKTEKTVSDNASKEVMIKESIASLSSDLSNLREYAEKLKAALAFSSKATAKKHISKLNSELKRMQNNYNSAERRLRECDAELNKLEGSIKAFEENLKNSEEFNIEQLRIENTELIKNKKQLSEEKDSIKTRIELNTKELLNIEKSGTALKKLESNINCIKPLSDTANGTLRAKEKISLETYVQMTYFDRILARANSRLKNMTNGQFELKRRENGGIRGKSGLDINILDHCNGSERSVETLSGGESFKASLSLALGLSDEIQSSSGGVKLDTMFVDEGFGSLDEESLRQAINTLSGLSEGNKLVGIISHVSELKDRIDNQIIVSKSTSGTSRAKIVTQ